jgi:hypothetical protein
VAVQGGTFTKAPRVSGGASGIIYGNDGSVNRNKAIKGETGLTNDMGHAVYIMAGPKHRELTVLPDQLLDSTVADGWIE